ncbi:unnamed protein product [Phaeothamnion confervicola]
MGVVDDDPTHPPAAPTILECLAGLPIRQASLSSDFRFRWKFRYEVAPCFGALPLQHQLDARGFRVRLVVLFSSPIAFVTMTPLTFVASAASTPFSPRLAASRYAAAGSTLPCSQTLARCTRGARVASGGLAMAMTTHRSSPAESRRWWGALACRSPAASPTRRR